MPGAYLTLMYSSSLRNQSYAYGCGGFKTPQGFYSHTHLSTSTDVDHMFSVASSPATRMGSENPPDELQVSDEVFAQIKAWYCEFNGRQQPILSLASGVIHQTQIRVPQTKGTQEEERKEERGRARRLGSGRPRRGVRPESWTPRQAKRKSKLGRGLNMETLVATQGVSSSLALGPTIAGAIPGSHEFASQASTEGTGGQSDPQEKVGTEDAHDDEETDKERWERLMHHADGVWRCASCGGRAFSDCCALQRHCKSAVHGKQRDKQKCPVCSKKYQRLGHLTRHMDQKHKGAVKPKEGEGLL